MLCVLGPDLRTTYLERIEEHKQLSRVYLLLRRCREMTRS
jgi:hypothetical protein